MFIFFDWERLESALVKMSGSLSMVMRVPTHGVRMRQPAKEFGHLCIGLGLNDEVPVVRHHAVSVDWERHARMSQFQHPIIGSGTQRVYERQGVVKYETGSR